MNKVEAKIKEHFLNDLINEIPDKGSIVIFGACPVGERILNDIKEYKKDVKILGFIDNNVEGEFNNLPIWNLKEFIDLKLDVDLIVMSTRTNIYISWNILLTHDYLVLLQTPFINDYYRKGFQDFIENWVEIINMFSDLKYKKLYDILYLQRVTRGYAEEIKAYQKLKGPKFCVTNTQYLDEIEQDKVKVIIDAGYNNGMNVIGYEKILKNLEKVYGFEAIYDYAKNDTIEKFIDKNKVEIIPNILGEEKETLDFYLHRKHHTKSFVQKISTRISDLSDPEYEIIKVDATTIDDFCNQKNVKPDLIKMDIEGAELPALKGGIKSIKKYRPQLAICIYHSNEDFIKIPLYLKHNLENYEFRLGHYSNCLGETILYAIPKELI